MDYPNSPYYVAKSILDEFRSGHRSLDDYLDSLDVFENFLKQWATGVRAMPDVPDFEQGAEIKSATLESLDLYSEAVVLFRHFAQSGQDESAKQGLQLAREAHALMLHLHKEAFQEANRIEDAMG